MATKTRRTHKQRFGIFLRILLIIVLVIAIVFGILAIVSMIGAKSNSNFISKIKPAEYESQLAPVEDENGYTAFVTDEEFKVLQLTDVHLGGGFMSIGKDAMAINAVASMLKAEKPDLVIVTGDIAYPVPFQAGTFNNKTGAKLFAQLMEQLQIYWCPVFGNHDTEAYSYFSREKISEFYSNPDFKYCLFDKGSDDVDGYGNYIVNVEKTNGEITQSFIMFDSHSYTDNDYFGALWKYDCIHTKQIEWYENELSRLTEVNNGVTPKSLAFFHIPLIEYRDAWYEYMDNGYQDTDNVKCIYGKTGETGKIVYSSSKNSGLFDKALELGSTQGFFCGHDHANNFSVDYKGIRLSYGYSIDYLAYIGIKNFGAQRGCTIINVMPDGSFDSHLENYYQDKYISEREKEEVELEREYNEDDLINITHPAVENESEN